MQERHRALLVDACFELVDPKATQNDGLVDVVETLRKVEELLDREGIEVSNPFHVFISDCAVESATTSNNITLTPIQRL